MKQKISIYLVVSVAIVFSALSAAAQSSSCSDPSLNNFSRRVDRQEQSCIRAQNRIEQMNIRKADALERLNLNEDISNSQQSTSSWRCWLREAFPGECRARRRRRVYVEMVAYLERYYNRRLAPLHRRASRDCERFAETQAAFQSRVDACQAAAQSR
jgi:hypothetical protein